MLVEYAVDPSVLGNWNDFRHLVSHFGQQHGRMISQFPKKWKALVYDAAAKNTEIDRKRIEESLKNIDDKLFRQSREYDGGKPWIRNAIACQLDHPFRAIIGEANPDELYYVLRIDELDEPDKCCVLWHVHKECRVARNMNAMVICALPLLSQSRHIQMVDPHFGPESPRYRRTLQGFADAALRVSPGITRFEYHLEAKSTHEFFSQTCLQELPRVIPKSLQIRFVRWKQRNGGEKLHPRYLLTDVAGLRYEAGLDEGRDGETVDVTLLDPGLYSVRWKEFQDASPSNMNSTFEYVDEVTVEGLAP